MATPFDPTFAPKVVYRYFEQYQDPSPTKLASLTPFSQSQYDFYKSIGVVRPEFGPFEALGVGFSETGEFAERFGSLDTNNFVRLAYSTVFDRFASDVQRTHFIDQVNFFQATYLSAGVPAGQAQVHAFGAIVGQMLAIAAYDEPASHPKLVPAGHANLIGVSNESHAADFFF